MILKNYFNTYYCIKNTAIFTNLNSLIESTYCYAYFWFFLILILYALFLWFFFKINYYEFFKK